MAVTWDDEKPKVTWDDDQKAAPKRAQRRLQRRRKTPSHSVRLQLRHR